MRRVATSKIYLSGGGNEKQSFPLDKFFFDKIPKKSRFLYVPVALKRHKLYAGTEDWMCGILKMHGRTDLSFDVVRNLADYEQLDGYTFVYIGGGNTWDLMGEFDKTGFSKKLINYFRDGGIVYGGSAGAIILGDYIDTQDDENFIKLKDPSGLAILSGYSVACHYEDGQQEYFRNWAAEHRSSIICIPEESGVVVVGRLGKCIGTKSCVVFSSDGSKKYLAPGDNFEM